MLRVIWTLVKMKVLAQREAYSFGRQVTLSGHYTQVPQRKAMMSEIDSITMSAPTPG